jgi:hypothetical protein
MPAAACCAPLQMKLHMLRLVVQQQRKRKELSLARRLSLRHSHTIPFTYMLLAYCLIMVSIYGIHSYFDSVVSESTLVGFKVFVLSTFAC